MKKKLFIDFDDTLVDSTMVVVHLYNQIYSENADHTLIRAYDLSDQCQRLGELTGNRQKELQDLYAHPDFWKLLKPKANVIDVLNKFKAEGYELVMVSYGNPENLAYKVHYAHEIFPMFDGYILLSQHERPFTKQDVNMEDAFFIDDYAPYLVESNAKSKIMFGESMKGNRNPGFFSTKSWDSVYNYVKQIYDVNHGLSV